MRITKILLELLLENFTKRYAGSGLCMQIDIMFYDSLISQFEREELTSHITAHKYKNLSKTAYAFGEGEGNCFQIHDKLKANHPRRVEWIKQMINELEEKK